MTALVQEVQTHHVNKVDNFKDPLSQRCLILLHLQILKYHMIMSEQGPILFHIQHLMHER